MSVQGSPTKLSQDAEVRVLAFASVHEFIVAGQVNVLLQSEERESDAWLGALERAGLIRRSRGGGWVPDVFRITRAGLESLGSDLPPPGPSQQWVHDYAVGWLWVAAARERFGRVDRILTAREMRGLDATAGRSSSELPSRRRLGLALDGDHGGDRLHYPDLLLVADWGNVAFELVVAPVAAERLEAVLRAYESQGSVRVVVFMVPDAWIAEVIDAEARRLGVMDRVRIHVFRGGLGGGRRRISGG